VAVHNFFRDKSIHSDFSEKIALKLRQDSDVHAIIKKIAQKRNGFKGSVLTRFDAFHPFFDETLTLGKHQLFSPGPAKRVSPQAARERERQLAVQESNRGGGGEFEKK
jgi:hypothetical protein